MFGTDPSGGRGHVPDSVGVSASCLLKGTDVGGGDNYSLGSPCEVLG